MLTTSRLGSISTSKERLAIVILELLRNIAPEAGYQFRELSGGLYQLELIWGNDSKKIIFTAEHAAKVESEEGREAVRGSITAAIFEMLKGSEKKNLN
jgi:hypothetical protein